MANFILTEEQYRQIVVMEQTVQTPPPNPATNGKYATVSVQSNGPQGNNPTKQTTTVPTSEVKNTMNKEVSKLTPKMAADTVITSNSTDENGVPSKPTKPNNFSSINRSGNIIGDGRIITKKQLREMRLKRLKENSVVYKLGDFLRK